VTAPARLWLKIVCALTHRVFNPDCRNCWLKLLPKEKTK
jgi:hypothetical protein